jgi:hypothetical protein
MKRATILNQKKEDFYMKTYSTAAAAIALGMSEAAIIEQLGETKGKITFAQILTLDDTKQAGGYNSEAEEIRDKLSRVKAVLA